MYVLCKIQIKVSMFIVPAYSNLSHFSTVRASTPSSSSLARKWKQSFLLLLKCAMFCCPLCCAVEHQSPLLCHYQLPAYSQFSVHPFHTPSLLITNVLPISRGAVFRRLCISEIVWYLALSVWWILLHIVSSMVLLLHTAQFHIFMV